MRHVDQPFGGLSKEVVDSEAEPLPNLARIVDSLDIAYTVGVYSITVWHPASLGVEICGPTDRF